MPRVYHGRTKGEAASPIHPSSFFLLTVPRRCFCCGLVGKSNFSEQFRKLIKRYKRIGYSLDIMRKTACLVNPIIVDGYASLFNRTTAVRASDNDGLFIKL